MTLMLRRHESRRDCPKLAGGVSPRFHATTGKAPAGAVELVKAIYETLR